MGLLDHEGITFVEYAATVRSEALERQTGDDAEASSGSFSAAAPVGPLLLRNRLRPWQQRNERVGACRFYDLCGARVAGELSNHGHN